MAQYYHFKEEPVSAYRYACVGKLSMDDPEVGDVILCDCTDEPMLFFKGKKWRIRQGVPIKGKKLRKGIVIETMFRTRRRARKFVKYAKANPDLHTFVLEYHQHCDSGEVTEIKVVPIVEDRVKPVEAKEPPTADEQTKLAEVFDAMSIPNTDKPNE